jgi:DNA-binding GntR family transcriptional regulator
MTVDPASEWPLTAQLAQVLRATIRAAELEPGDKIPSEHELVGQHHVSRATANRALTILADEGLIARRRGSGSVVTSAGAGHRRTRLTRAALPRRPRDRRHLTWESQHQRPAPGGTVSGDQGKDSTHSSPLSTYSAPGGLRQDPGRAA